MRYMPTLSSKLVAGVALLAVSSFLMAQTNVKQQMFQEADKAMQEAKKVQADVLAPESFEEGMEYYEKANKGFDRGGDLNDIRKQLKKSVRWLDKSAAASRIAEVSLSAALRARTDAVSANAPKYASESWEEAESSFAKAAGILENGNVKKSQRRAAEAEREYRASELKAIKFSYLSETQALLSQAEEMKAERYAPKTLQKSRDLLAQAEKALDTDRYDTDVPRSLVRQAKHEAKHAISISKNLQAIKEGNLTQEDLYLAQEAPVVAMESQVEHLENKLGGATAESEALRKRIETEAAIQRTFVNLEKKFDRKTAEVFRQGNDVIIRLVGLNFAVGKSDIESKNFSLLKEVKEAIEAFPIDKLIVEGHTDSHGGDASNLALSQSRAVSVREYLLVDMNISASSIEAVGYGETRPVANNETADGRRKNRRIDIVIQPKL